MKPWIWIKIHTTSYISTQTKANHVFLYFYQKQTYISQFLQQWYWIYSILVKTNSIPFDSGLLTPYDKHAYCKLDFQFHLRQVVYVVNAWINKIDVDLMIYQVFVENSLIIHKFQLGHLKLDKIYLRPITL